MSLISSDLVDGFFAEGNGATLTAVYQFAPVDSRERFAFGRIYPRAYAESHGGAEMGLMQTECIARGAGPESTLAGRVRFLQAVEREIYTALPSGAAAEPVAELHADGDLHQAGHEPLERDIAIPEILLAAPAVRTLEFYFPGAQVDEIVRDAEGEAVGVVRRRRHVLAGEIEVKIEPLNAELVKITVAITNRTPLSSAEIGDVDAILLCTLASTHTVLRVRGAQFDSLTDPPAADALAIIACENIGTWPVLVGDKPRQERHTILSSPIILYDYPHIAAESARDLYDGLEIDEMLSLRTPPLTEQGESGEEESFVSRILEPFSMPEDRPDGDAPSAFDDIHFPSGNCFKDARRVDGVLLGGIWHRVGDRVRIKPLARSDGDGGAAAGRKAVIRAIEQDDEEQQRLTLDLEEDGAPESARAGHRFSYKVDEVEPLQAGER